MSLDPITFAVVKSALDAVVDEMATAVTRTARSEIIRDVMDLAAGWATSAPSTRPAKCASAS